MENHSEHTPEQQPSPTTPTEASKAFLDQWIDRIPPKYRRPLGFVYIAGLIGGVGALGGYKAAIAAGALGGVAAIGASLANRYYEKKDTNKNH